MTGPGRLRRSSFGSWNAGTGIAGHPYHYGDKDVANYKPRRCDSAPGGVASEGPQVTAKFKTPGVNLPHEKPEEWAALSGPCITIVEGKKL